ncbi:uncharacterized protein N7482_004996 [Penicillium canariense]|uniref:Uncharacterized protein n=1 Tax=Penicillium canariense TaxID=189055 RepID=A0A9W9I1I8_9EURO|nr:uncharacterized protein N7482_004996 [Penicillium canariense]KAJ5166215.1 hypothetical protein N7482_004996 [Penicillium canariense]
MSRDTFSALALTQIFVLWIRSITPLSVFYCVAWILNYLPKHWAAKLLGLYALAETCFYFLVFLPRNRALQQDAIHPDTDRESRQELVRKCIENIPNPERFISLWNRGTPPSQVHRENFKEWLCWAYFNKSTWDDHEDEELNNYVQKFETLLGYLLPEGRDPSKSLRVSLDPGNIYHRPLVYYVLGIGGADLVTYLFMRYHGYQHYALSRWCLSFPFRPQTIFSQHRSTAKHLSYWYRPHTSKDSLPIMYIHGIGILYTYMRLFGELSRALDADSLTQTNGSTGVIVFEVLPISLRMTHPALLKSALCAEILSVLDRHKWDKFVLMATSFSSVISSQMLHDTLLAPRIGPIIFTDPVPFLLHLPDITYNFTQRKPKTACQLQLYYFASRDMGAAHTLGRRFFWNESILWKENILGQGRRVSVILCEKDIVVDTTAVGHYLTRSDGVRATDDWECDDDSWKRRGWEGGELDVLWMDGLHHAELLNTKRDRQILIDIALNYATGAEEPIRERGNL